MHATFYSRDHGFTLIELLTALTLVAVIAVSVIFAVRISLSSWRKATQVIDTNQRRRSISQLLHSQVASIYGLTAPGAPGEVSAPFFAGTRKRMEFLTLSSLRSNDRQGLTLAEYEAVGDSSGLYSIVQRERPYLGTDGRSLPTWRTAETNTLAAGLSDVIFEYFDPGTRDSPPNWAPEWKARQKGRLPAAISITFLFRDQRGPEPGEKIVVPIHAKPFEAKQSFVDYMVPQPRQPKNTGAQPPPPPPE